MWLSLLVALAVGNNIIPLCSGDDSNIQRLGNAITNFGMDLHKILSLKTDNVMFSPVGVHMALAMILLGATGRTSMELKTVLELNRIRDFDAVYKKWLDVKDPCSAGVKCPLSISNSLWKSPSVVFHDKFTRKLMQYYAPSIGVPNTTARASPLNDVNQWIREKAGIPTHNILLPDQVPDSLSTLFILNTLNLQPSWKNLFPANLVYDMQFKTKHLRIHKTKAMKAKGQFGHAFSKALKSNLVRIPLINTRFGFYIVVPLSADGLEEVENRLVRRSVNIATEFQAAILKEVEVHLPKMNIVHSINLLEPLLKMGLRSAFSRRPEFSQMTGSRVYLNYVMHLSRLSLDISNVSIGAGSLLSLRSEPVPASVSATVVRASNPFLYFVRDDEHNILILQGRFMQPSDESFVEY